ncbi:hypothetical protein D1345_04035 [Chromobacterium rhizoryzae]|uniref:Uncharacterized protein n=1 Tax=Chromobacterium rhizoryzae TaxID=1778675 RepID=A0AAD0RPP0_9NEIS|nr:hypothetical protein D1345_04035 [Chromobacterium rhizoryzae]
MERIMAWGIKGAWGRFWGRLGRLWWEGMRAHAQRALRDETEELERVRYAALSGGRQCANPVDCARNRRVFH